MNSCGTHTYCNTICALAGDGATCPTLDEVWAACDAAGVTLSALFSAAKTDPQPV